MVLLLDDAGSFAATPAQVIELGAAHLAAAQDLDRVDHGRIERKDALHALAVRNLAHREVFVEPGARAADADALVGLDAGALALDHLDVDEEGIAGLEVRNFLAGGKLGNLLFLELLDQIHGNSPSGSAKCGRRGVLIGWAGRASSSDPGTDLPPFRPRLAAGSFRSSLPAGSPQVRPPRPREPLGLGAAPGRNLGVIPRCEDLRNRAALPELGPRILRVFEQPLREAFL